MTGKPDDQAAARAAGSWSSARSALLLAVLALLVFAAYLGLRDRESVGEFMQVVLCASSLLLAVSLVGEFRKRQRRGVPDQLAPPTASAGTEEPMRWRDIGVATLGAATLAASVIVLGVFAGLFVGTFVVGILFTSMRWVDLLKLAVLTGIVVPGLFAWALGARLWSGVVPELLAGWVGGGSLPPL